jgi:hypothetical protein
MLMSSIIDAKGERPEVLSPELKSKVERYVVYWRKQSGGSWPTKAAVSDGTKPASFFERTADRIHHRALRSFDLIVPFLYSFVPVSVWQRYRQVKSRYQQIAVKPSGNEAV